MFTRLLVTLDGSPASAQVLPVVERLFGPVPGRGWLLRVIERSLPALLADEQGRLGPAVEARLRESLVQTAAELTAAGIHLEPLVARGDPATTITAIAEEMDAGLIAMATHGRGGVGRLALGSTADRVLHASRRPLLLVRTHPTPPPPAPIGHILLPLDGSQLSMGALPVARMLARLHGAVLHLLLAFEPVEAMARAAYHVLEVPLESSRARQRAALVTAMERVADQVTAAGVAASPSVVDGLPAPVILDAVPRLEAGLIVMSSHGRSGLSRWAYGSVAGQVLRAAPCPLLLIRPPAPETA